MFERREAAGLGVEMNKIETPAALLMAAEIGIAAQQDMARPDAPRRGAHFARRQKKCGAVLADAGTGRLGRYRKRFFSSR